MISGSQILCEFKTHLEDLLSQGCYTFFEVLNPSFGRDAGVSMPGHSFSQDGPVRVLLTKRHLDVTTPVVSLKKLMKYTTFHWRMLITF